MDIDAFVAAHGPRWRRLEELARRRRLSGPESDELVDGYQEVATHLSVVRSSAPDAALVAYLSSVLARARTRTTGTRTASWRDVGTFLGATFPAALYRTRRWWIGTLLVDVAVAAVMILWLLQHPGVQSTLVPPAEADRLVDVDFERYYSTYAASHFAAQVWTNNAWVAALCISLGVFGLPVVYLLLTNVLNVAVIGALMIQHGRGSLFFGLILPHGLLELTAVFVAAGVGLRLFWSWVDPGPRTRGQSLAHEGRSAVAVALGLVLVLLVSGVIEAFVTPSPLPTWARIGIGAAAEALFFGYVFGPGRRAFRAGHTGDLAADRLEDQVATAG
ncbi:stage II sporulation protein M [Nocardioides panacis]|uniref:Stage II sporulation protein M n=1 Tax=Nocardioides panacis TaxID=2849501 RepID=A0A975XZ22_9ACTN|nr:stage II sporulation protein M [Nocardioides panacis]QWZ06980.1 stage II sporulation protein M [Nocardioides panacis]